MSKKRIFFGILENMGYASTCARRKKNLQKLFQISNLLYLNKRFEFFFKFF